MEKTNKLTKIKVVNHLLDLIKARNELEITFSGQDDHRMTFQTEYQNGFGINRITGVIDVRTTGLGLFQFSIIHSLESGVKKTFEVSLERFNINQDFVDIDGFIARLAYELYDLVKR